MKAVIKTGDTVKIISGEQKGKTAKIIKVAPKEGKAYLEGIGVRTRHMRPTQYQKGGKKEIHVGIDLSNLKLEKSTASKPEAKKGDKK